MLSFRGERLDVATEAHWAMTVLAGRAARQGVGLELAVSPGLAVWMDPRAFRKLLVETVAQAIARRPGPGPADRGARMAEEVQIGVSHDGVAAPREALETALRPSTEIAAMNGGTLEVKVRAGQGATVLVRMPEPTAHPAQASNATATPTAAAPSRPNSENARGDDQPVDRGHGADKPPAAARGRTLGDDRDRGKHDRDLQRADDQLELVVTMELVLAELRLALGTLGELLHSVGSRLVPQPRLVLSSGLDRPRMSRPRRSAGFPGSTPRRRGPLPGRSFPERSSSRR